LQYGVNLCGLYDLQIVYTTLFQSTLDPFLKGIHRAVQNVVPHRVYRSYYANKSAAKRLWSLQGAAPTALKRPLTEEAISYATADVTPLLEMYRVWRALVHERAVISASTNRLDRYLKASACALPLARDTVDGMSRVDFTAVRRRQSHRPCVLITTAAAPPPCINADKERCGTLTYFQH
jgi:hypothetical protein